jgi:hypothetical protein
MSGNFKQKAQQQRSAVQQVNLEPGSPTEAPKPVFTPSTPSQATQPVLPAPEPVHEEAETPVTNSSEQRITIVDTSETPTNRGFSMYPTRHRQLAKDLAYLEDRNPWKIIDDALEEYVVRHYGKQFKRK